jgi:predicted nucleic acid-binding protein
MEIATELLRRSKYEARSEKILELAAQSGCSAYDCEFVALAMELGVPLVTADRHLAGVFDPPAIHLSVFS